MISARRIITILGTLFCALATGFFMQHVLQKPAAKDQQGSVQVASVGSVDSVLALTETNDTLVEGEDSLVTATVANGTVDPAILPEPPAAMVHPEELPTPQLRVAALDDQPVRPLPQEEPAPRFNCEVTVTATPSAAAMVNVSVSAPCLKDQRYTLHHNGLKVTDVTNNEGTATIQIPALAEKAVFIISFDSGESAVATTSVSTVELYDRSVILWSGPEGVQLHALEYGADYGDAGHVWIGAAQDLAQDLAEAAQGQGGFITRVGGTDVLNPHMAEVYTFPMAAAKRDGLIEMSVEAEVTQANCGRDLSAQVLRKTGANPMKVHDLMLAMPDCDAVGEFLVLKNLLEDLNIARN